MKWNDIAKHCLFPRNTGVSPLKVLSRDIKRSEGRFVLHGLVFSPQVLGRGGGAARAGGAEAAAAGGLLPHGLSRSDALLLLHGLQLKFHQSSPGIDDSVFRAGNCAVNELVWFVGVVFRPKVTFGNKKGTITGDKRGLFVSSHTFTISNDKCRLYREKLI